MRTAENVERTRQWLIERIRQERGDHAEKTRKVELQLHLLEKQRIELAQQLTRAMGFDPNNGQCPRCAILRGVEVQLKPVTFAGVPADAAETVEVMVCPICMWDDSVTM